MVISTPQIQMKQIFKLIPQHDYVLRINYITFTYSNAILNNRNLNNEHHKNGYLKEKG